MAYIAGQEIGSYRIIKQIGAGGFAEVYLGEHVHLGTQAAIKALHAQLANAEEIENFRKEARTIAQLLHPNIIRVLDFNIQNNMPFFVMDLAPHGSLRERHKRGEQVPFETVITYTKQAASALQFAHERKFIHRDIKPENMLVGHHQEILVSDFGIAVVAQSTRMATAQDMAGTIPYMAPEQIQAHPRPASDQYALAITVYEWLTGKRPFDGTFTEIAVKQTTVPPPPPSQFVTIAPGTEQVILKALEKAPEQRFPDVSTFASALERSRQGYTIASTLSATPNQGQTLHVPEPAWRAFAAPQVAATISEKIATPPPPPRGQQASYPYATPYNSGQSFATPPGYGNIYGYPPVPPQKALFPLLRGKPRGLDALYIGLYAVVGFILFTILEQNASSSAVATAHITQVVLLITLLFLWYFTSGCLLGFWRSLLALLSGSVGALLYINMAVTHQDTTGPELLSFSLIPLIGALLGLGYELRKQQKKLHSFLLFALGILLFFFITEFFGGTTGTAISISDLLILACLSPVLAIVPLLGELMVRGIVRLVFRFKNGGQAA
ncbi:hypothetical protein KSC_014240 [Ktedonobacter sp. SOSP1-52]|uniref:serine/threonine-protein kinase n=1 Tax=Ktedonobacter sp. SOSP1-52 TaxID=2778366 RepID=UPI001915DA1C|nr:serine/threonine-protein kinase [Ktedonobacter sp. SOSP1-52]GHO62532.1 hypothetical protein KSC_014240 [Ktedonobacter sp. SOSP1-52]